MASCQKLGIILENKVIFGWSLTLKIDFASQMLALFNSFTNTPILQIWEFHLTTVDF